jgi:CRP/FNR family cyclic AMP-dependent transcriptional regulator
MSAVTSSLQQIFLLRDLRPEALALLEQASTSLTVDAGREIFREGQPADSLYLIRSGSVRVSKPGNDSDVVMLGTGSHFGELALVDDGPRSASVTAIERCEVLRVDTAALRMKLDAAPQVAAVFYRAVARSLAKRLRVTTDDLTFARQLALERRR